MQQDCYALILKYNLSKDLKILDKEEGWKKGGYYYLLALQDLETMMNPDYVWYDKTISFDNGYEASIICKPFSHGNREKLFEVAVYKLGEMCYDTHSDVQEYLSFEDVVEILHNIHDLPPAEKNDAGEYEHEEEREKKKETEKEKRQQQKAEQSEYTVPPGPIGGVSCDSVSWYLCVRRAWRVCSMLK